MCDIPMWDETKGCCADADAKPSKWARRNERNWCNNHGKIRAQSSKARRRRRTQKQEQKRTKEPFLVLDNKVIRTLTIIMHHYKFQHCVNISYFQHEKVVLAIANNWNNTKGQFRSSHKACRKSVAIFRCKKGKRSQYLLRLVGTRT